VDIRPKFETDWQCRFATALEGVDINNPGTALDRSGHPNPVPRIVGKIRRKQPVQMRDVEFLRANTSRAIKITVPGPFTMSQQAQNEFYKDEQEMVLDYAAAVNAEIKDLFAAGADIVQIDEPYMQARPEKARQYGLRGLDAALDGVKGATAIHICFGYAAIIHVRPSGYSFLPELAASPVKQISIETARAASARCRTFMFGSTGRRPHATKLGIARGCSILSSPAAAACETSVRMIWTCSSI